MSSEVMQDAMESGQSMLPADVVSETECSRVGCLILAFAATPALVACFQARFKTPKLKGWLSGQD